ncbi:MAG: hypothetical protein GX139_05905 [Armatimonadetes bacterium]|nr:hypothetical protein [Armatimonadota bacterium]
MRNRTLVAVLAMLFCLVSVTAVIAAPAKPAAKTTKAPAKATAAPAKPAAPKTFDQAEELQRFWGLPDTTVMGTVDGASVTKGQLIKSLWSYSAPQMLTEVLNQRMVEQAAKKAGVTLTPAEQKEKEDEAIKRMGVASMDDLLRQFKVTKARFIAGIRTSALAEKIVRQQVKVTDAEYAEYIRARHILVKFPEDEEDQAKKEEVTKKKIDEIAAKLKDGADFASLADEYSEDPGNLKDGAKQGGDLGWFTKGRMVAEFESAAFDLPVGKISDPVKTFYGYHLIKVDGIGKDASPVEKNELKTMILERQVPMEMQKWFSELQAKSKMDNKLMEPASQQPKPVVRPQPAPAPNAAPPPPPGK